MTKLDLGSQVRKGEDYEWVGPEFLLSPPWPYPDESIDATWSNHFIERIPHHHPNWSPDVDGWWMFFAELHRVLKPRGVAEFKHFFSRADAAFIDPAHTRYVHFSTWHHMNKDWREKLGLDPDGIPFNWDIERVDALDKPIGLETRSGPQLDFANQFYFNPTINLYVKLVKA